MARITGVTTSMAANRWIEEAEPYDAKTIFNTKEQALEQLDKVTRFKGQKFVVKNPPVADSINGEPKEYIFLEDYQAPGSSKWVWIFDNGDDFFKNLIDKTKTDITDSGITGNNIRDKLVELGIIQQSQWAQIWANQAQFPTYWENKADKEIIPEPVLYKPGGDGGGDGGIPEAPDDGRQYARQDCAWTEATGDRLRAETACKNDASLNRKHEPLYVNDIDRPLTINEYADRQPGAKLYNKHEFGNILRTIKNKEDYKITLPNNTKQQGEIKMSYNVLTLDSKDKTFLHTYPKGKTGDSFTIPNSVTSIGSEAFYNCTNLTGVTFVTGSNIADADFGNNAFPQGNSGYGGNTLKDAYSTGKAGTYTRAPNGTFSSWTKQQ